MTDKSDESDSSHYATSYYDNHDKNQSARRRLGSRTLTKRAPKSMHSLTQKLTVDELTTSVNSPERGEYDERETIDSTPPRSPGDFGLTDDSMSSRT